MEKSTVKLSAKEAMLLASRLDTNCKMCEMDGHSCNYCPVTRFMEDLVAIARLGKATKCQCGYPLESTVEILTGQCEDCVNLSIERERIRREMRAG